MRISDWSSDVCSSDLEQALVLRGIAGLRQSDNDDMDMRLAARVGTPCKGAVREGNFQPASVEEGRPELRHLLAPGDRVGRDAARTEERRVGKGGVGTCRSRVSPDH